MRCERCQGALEMLHYDERTNTEWHECVECGWPRKIALTA
jgi:Zn ribbon nucleic-acid-binding protein